MKKKLAAARKRIENGDGVKGGDEEVEVSDAPLILLLHCFSHSLILLLHCFSHSLIYFSSIISTNIYISRHRIHHRPLVRHS